MAQFIPIQFLLTMVEWPKAENKAERIVYQGMS